MTLDDIKGRCFITDDGHWLWRGALSDGHPRIWAPNYSKPGAPKTGQHGKRAVWNVVNQKPLPQGWRVFGTCIHTTCINPACIDAGPGQAWGERLSKSIARKGKLARITASRLTGQKRSLLTPERIEEAKASPKTGRELAREWGVSEQVISRARNGQVKCFQPVGGLFTGLMAANDSKRRAA